jgi:hypothetical protein
MRLAARSQFGLRLENEGKKSEEKKIEKDEEKCQLGESNKE